MSEEDKNKIREVLRRPFPPAVMQKRKGAGGKDFTYIATHVVVRRLDEAVDNIDGGFWSFEITSDHWTGNVYVVNGRLEISGLGVRSGTGVQAVAEKAGEDLIKGAASDCLKKCATYFGVALDLYGDDLEQLEEDRQARRSGGYTSAGGTERQSDGKSSAAGNGGGNASAQKTPRPWLAEQVKEKIGKKLAAVYEESPGTARMAADPPSIEAFDELIAVHYGRDAQLRNALVDFFVGSNIVTEGLVYVVESYLKSTDDATILQRECKGVVAYLVRNKMYLPAAAQQAFAGVME